MDRQEEQEVIYRVRRGDTEAFSLLVAAYQGTVFNLTYRMTGNRQEADDLAQDIFLRAYRNLWRFDPEKKFFTWLFTIALNTVRNHLKSRPRREMPRAEAALLSPAAGDPSDPEALLLSREEERRLEACLQRLPPDLREIIVLRYYQGLSFDEIAGITALSVSAVKMRTYRTLQRLGALMKEP